MVHEELQGVQRLVQLWQPGRRPRRGAPHSLDEVGEVGAGDALHPALGEERERGEHDARAAHGIAVTYDEVRQQVPDRPLAAERWGVRSDHEGRVAEAVAFGPRERRHPPSLVSGGGVDCPGAVSAPADIKGREYRSRT